MEPLYISLIVLTARRDDLFIEYFEIMLNCRPKASADERLPEVLYTAVLCKTYHWTSDTKHLQSRENKKTNSHTSSLSLALCQFRIFSSATMTSSLPGVSLASDRETKVRFSSRESSTSWNFQLDSDKLLKGDEGAGIISRLTLFPRCLTAWSRVPRKLLNL